MLLYNVIILTIILISVSLWYFYPILILIRLRMIVVSTFIMSFGVDEPVHKKEFFKII